MENRNDPVQQPISLVFGVLPIDVFMYILSFVNISSLAALNSTSKEFYKIATNEWLWKQRFAAHFSSNPYGYSAPKGEINWRHEFSSYYQSSTGKDNDLIKLLIFLRERDLTTLKKLRKRIENSFERYFSAGRTMEFNSLALKEVIRQKSSALNDFVYDWALSVYKNKALQKTDFSAFVFAIICNQPTHRIEQLLNEHWKDDFNIQADLAGMANFAAEYNRIELFTWLLDHKKVPLVDNFIFRAIVGNAMDVIKLLLSRGVDVNARNNKDQTPLMVTIEGGDNIEVVKLLVEKGAKIDAKMANVFTLLLLAIKEGRFKCTQYFLNDAITSLGNNRLEGIALGECLTKNLDLFKFLVDNYKVNIDAQGVNGRSLLQQLIKIEQHTSAIMKVIPYLLEKNANLEAMDDDGNTPLMLAIKNKKSIRLISYLLEKNIRLNTCNKKGKNALQLAAASFNIPVVKLLLEKGQNDCCSVLELPNKHGNTFLIEVVQNLNTYLPQETLKLVLEVITLLITNNANIEAKDKDGNTPLMSAIGLKQKKLFLTNIENDQDKSLMAAGIYSRQIKIVERLLALNANIEAKNKDGETPIMYAVSNRGVEQGIEIVKLLVDNYANLEVKNNRQQTPLMIAVIKKQTDVVALFLNKLRLIKNDNINATDDKGDTALMLAAASGAIDIVKMLLDNKANINASNIKGETPLMQAIQNGQVDVVNMLLENKADIDAINTKGETPLTIAAISGNIVIVKILLGKGAKAFSKDVKKDVKKYVKNYQPAIYELFQDHGIVGSKVKLHVQSFLNKITHSHKDDENNNNTPKKKK